MTEYEYHDTVHRLLMHAYHESADPIWKKEYLSAAVNARARAREQVNTPRPTIVFGLAPGFVTIGELGKETVLPHPGKAGLDYAWDIMAHGVEGRAYLLATDFVHSMGLKPGNTLRTAIREAADWVENEARCWRLATAMRSPVLSITDPGAITFNSTKAPASIRLSL